MFEAIYIYFQNRRQKKYLRQLSRAKSLLNPLKKQVDEARKSHAWALGEPWELSAFDRLSAACDRYNKAVSEYNHLVSNPPK